MNDIYIVAVLIVIIIVVTMPILKISRFGKKPSREIVHFIVNVFEEEKKYMDPEFTLTTLTEKSGYTGNSLSEAVKFRYQKKFQDMIDYSRIAYFKNTAKVMEGDVNIRQLAKESGFNSIVSFERVFKTSESASPSAYIENLQKELGNDSSKN
ncbi:MAG: AraC family transcriptional regulator [Gammaproteobacteria bacterium]|nr:AraC family transcriptional regulator [Gammaproteobacteria bacterium]